MLNLSGDDATGTRVHAPLTLVSGDTAQTGVPTVAAHMGGTFTH
jgi:hypothetical protein